MHHHPEGGSKAENNIYNIPDLSFDDWGSSLDWRSPTQLMFRDLTWYVFELEDGLWATCQDRSISISCRTLLSSQVVVCCHHNFVRFWLHSGSEDGWWTTFIWSMATFGFKHLTNGLYVGFEHLFNGFTAWSSHGWSSFDVFSTFLTSLLSHSSQFVVARSYYHML